VPTPPPPLTPSPESSPTVLPLPLGLTVVPPEIVTRQEWGASDPAGLYRPHVPSRITIHHDGIFFDADDDPVARLKLIQRHALRTRRWVDIPYHFLIDLEGRIYAGRPVEAVGDTATNYDPDGHVSITLLGDYDVQRINSAQLEAIVSLASWLSLTYGIPPETIAGHRDYAATTCPGDTLYDAYFANGLLVEMVRQRVNALITP
jgi:hypothetical protein